MTTRSLYTRLSAREPNTLDIGWSQLNPINRYGFECNGSLSFKVNKKTQNTPKNFWSQNIYSIEMKILKNKSKLVRETKKTNQNNTLHLSSLSCNEMCLDTFKISLNLVLKISLVIICTIIVSPQKQVYKYIQYKNTVIFFLNFITSVS